ncbi:hypothetical protein [Pedobacter sp.]|uniref:hypothetical protein n=1 Tax=Pedobacter sp. TaxID=1411316 RepID=UPI0031D8B8FE
MDFTIHTLKWVKGELFEAAIILGFGFATIIAALLIWKIGTTSGSKALFWPFFVVGVIYVSIGAGMKFSNQKRMTELPKSYHQDKIKFISTEKARVEGFQYGYLISKIVATLFFVATLLIFWSTKNSTWQGIGIGLAYFALAGLAVDYFSQERADSYYSVIVQYKIKALG